MSPVAGPAVGDPGVLERLLRRDRVLILAALAVLVASAWAYVAHLASAMAGAPMDGMAMAGMHAWSPGEVALLFVMWAVMMVAMMLPSATPMILMFASVARGRRRRGAPYAPTAVFVAGYLLVWTAFSVAAALAQWGLHRAALLSEAMVSATPLLSGGVLIAAGLFQLTPLKRLCLSKCRSPLGFISTEWREGTGGALRMGLKHGAYCLGCCWVLMALLFVAGVMNLLWIAAIAGFVLLEKLAPRGEWAGRIAGVLLVAWGVWLLAAARPAAAQAGASAVPIRRVPVRIEAREGTWLAFDASPDGSSLAFDLLGQIWILPAAGGEARAVTDAVRDTAEDTDPAFAPDGRSLVFAGERAGHPGLWRVDVASGQVSRLTTAPDVDDQPAWSPDGRRLAFVRTVSEVAGEAARTFDALHILELAGGPPRLVPFGDSGRADVRDPAWSADGRTLYVVAAGPAPVVTPRGGPIWGVDIVSGRATRVTDSTVVARSPAASPDGRRLAYLARDSAGRWQVRVRELAGGAERRVSDDAEVTPRRVRWTPDGAALLYVAGGRLRQLELASGRGAEIPFVARLAFTREQALLRQRQFPAPGSRRPARGQLGLALSPDGGRVAMLALGKLWVGPVGGEASAVAAVPEGARDVEWAPAGDRVAYSVGSWGDEDVRVTELASGRGYAATSMPGREILPRWSPDGRWLAVVHGPADSAQHLLVLPADARDVGDASVARDLGEVDPGEWAVGLAGALAPAWSPDSRALLVVHPGRGPVVREPFALLAPTAAELVSLDGARRRLGRVPFQPTYVHWPNDTTVVFVTADRAWRARLDAAAGVWGEATPLGDDAALYLSAARDGAVLYVSGDGLRLRDAGGAVRRLGWPVRYDVPEPAPLVIRNARVLDGTGAAPTSPRDLLLRGGRIARIGPAGSIAAAGARVLDAAGGIVMPGLADLHFHYDGPEQLRGLLYNGVTVLRDEGSDIATLAARAEGGAAGVWPAPRITFGAFQVYTDWPFSNGLEQGLEPEQDPGHIGRVVALLGAHGAEHMKIRTFRGWAGNARLVRAAHAAGLRTTGHCVFPLALLAAGMDAKEHLGNNCGARFDGVLHDDLLQLLRGSGVDVDPTTVAYGWWALWLKDRGLLQRPDVAPFMVAIKRNRTFDLAASDPDYWIRDQDRTMLAQTRALHRAGIPLGVGTDAPELPWAVHLELERLVEAGLTPLEAIRAGTQTSARMLGHDEEMGTVAAGKLADLLVLEPGADPSRDIGATRRIRWVVLGGAVVDREGLLAAGGGAPTR